MKSSVPSEHQMQVSTSGRQGINDYCTTILKWYTPCTIDDQDEDHKQNRLFQKNTAVYRLSYTLCHAVLVASTLCTISDL